MKKRAILMLSVLSILVSILAFKVVGPSLKKSNSINLSHLSTDKLKSMIAASVKSKYPLAKDFSLINVKTEKVTKDSEWLNVNYKTNNGEAGNVIIVKYYKKFTFQLLKGQKVSLGVKNAVLNKQTNAISFSGDGDGSGGSGVFMSCAGDCGCTIIMDLQPPFGGHCTCQDCTMTIRED